MKRQLAQITNPAIGELGDNAAAATTGSGFQSYFIQIWQAIIVLGALLVLVYFLWGAIEWIAAGGDTSKVQKARDRMTQAIIGVIVLVGSFTIIEFISAVFFGGEFSLLQFTLPTP